MVKRKHFLKKSMSFSLKLLKLLSLMQIHLQNLVIRMKSNTMGILGGKSSYFSWFPGVLFTSVRWKKPGSRLLSRNESLFEMQTGLPGREIRIREQFGLKGTSGHNLEQPPWVEWVKFFMKGAEWQLWPPSSLSLYWFYRVTALTQVTSKVVSLIKSNLGQCLWTQGPISTRYLHLGVFLFFLISTFSTAFRFLLHFLSRRVFIMMCSAIKAWWWLWHLMSQVAVAEALLSRKKLESPQRLELVKKILFLHYFRFPWSMIIILIHNLLTFCFSYHPEGLET